MEGGCYRLREVALPFAYVYELDPPQRQQVGRCCRIQDDEACERLTDLLLEAARNRAAGGKGLDWDCLSSPLGKAAADPAAASGHTLIWGMVTTYGLRNHEIWHVDALPGGIAANPRMISVGWFSSTSDGSETKTGHRFAPALPEAWIERYRLNDLEHARAMLDQLRRSHSIRTTERPDGVLQFHNNEALSRVLSHWFRNSAREDRELPVKLYGWHQPRPIPGRPKPKAIRDRCKVDDLRHAWALHRLEGMNRRLALDEGGVHIPTPRRRGAQRLISPAPAAPASRPAPALPSGAAA